MIQARALINMKATYLSCASSGFHVDRPLIFEMTAPIEGIDFDFDKNGRNYGSLNI